MLAESWDLATDLSSVDITIRKGVKFHENEGDWGEVKAVDMAWVINRTNPSLNPESIAASAANFSALFGVVPIEVVDEYTIRDTFNNFDVRRASNILNQQASGGLTSMATPKKAFDDNGIRFEMPLFLGPQLGGGSGPAGEIGDAIAGFWQEIGIDVKVLNYAYAVFRPGLVSRTTVVPMLTSCDDGAESRPFDWLKGLVQTTLTRGGFGCAFESPEILNWHKLTSAEPDIAERIRIDKEYLEYMHNWALFPGLRCWMSWTLSMPSWPVRREWIPRL